VALPQDCADILSVGRLSAAPRGINHGWFGGCIDKDRTGAGLKRGWTPSSVRAACRIAQMNAARRAREAERVAIFWDLVEESALRVEQLTTRRRQYSKPPECLG
jgi:hypothetical protein